MHQVAGLATIHLHRLVFEYKRSLFVRVAREADRILCGRSPYLLGFYRAVWIVTVRTLDEAFVDAMMEGHVELCFLRQMARIAKLRLGLH